MHYARRLSGQSTSSKYEDLQDGEDWRTRRAVRLCVATDTELEISGQKDVLPNIKIFIVDMCRPVPEDVLLL